jgi:hypothetical protein
MDLIQRMTVSVRLSKELVHNRQIFLKNFMKFRKTVRTSLVMKEGNSYHIKLAYSLLKIRLMFHCKITQNVFSFLHHVLKNAKLFKIKLVVRIITARFKKFKRYPERRISYFHSYNTYLKTRNF